MAALDLSGGVATFLVVEAALPPAVGAYPAAVRARGGGSRRPSPTPSAGAREMDVHDDEHALTR